MEMFEVGGCVRDELMGRKSKDVDFSVVVSEADMEADRTKAGNLRTPFEVMERELKRRGFKIFVSTPKFLTVRAQFPRMADPALVGRERRNLTADFVLARKEADYTDGRRPDIVEAGTLGDDLARRDFTMNAIAKSPADNSYIDPFNGIRDISEGLIRAVGNAQERIEEDALRGLRAVRFAVTLNFSMDESLQRVISSKGFRESLTSVSVERVQQELDKAFRANTVETLGWLEWFGLTQTVFSRGLWLRPTLERP